jgi:3-hydroxyisobutyrate dehydrogenase-like beta-hydroxyacid dehydrogenase
MAQPRIGFIGIGLMGHGMAKNLLAKGFPLTFRVRSNRSNLDDLLAAGAKEVKTNAEVAAQSDVVILCVTGAPDIEEVVCGADGLLSKARDGMIIVDTATSEPEMTTRMRERCAKAHVAYVDAPLTRTPKEAEEGRLNTMVGADDATFATLKPILAAYCENIFHVGGPGAGHVIKLINNFIAQSIAVASAEGLAVAVKAGVDPKQLHAVISAGGVNSGVFQMVAGKALEGDLTGMKFTIDNARKDLRYYTHMVEALPFATALGEATHQALVQASVLGLGAKFVPSLIEAQEKLNGLKIVPKS